MKIPTCFPYDLPVPNEILEVEGAEKVKDEMKSLSRVINIVSFGQPITAVTAFLEDRYQSRYWHPYVIPTSVYPYVFPLLCLVEYIITANGIFISVWYLFLVSVYFRTSHAWMQLVE